MQRGLEAWSMLKCKRRSCAAVHARFTQDQQPSIRPRQGPCTQDTRHCQGRYGSHAACVKEHISVQEP